MSIFKLPDLGEGLPDAEIVRWLVSSGDDVERDQPLAEMETAKAVVEVPSPQKGRIQQLHGQPGDVIKTGEPLVTFTDQAEQIIKPGEATKQDKPATASSTHIFKLPDLGEGLQEAEIVEWKIQPGQTIEKDQIIASMETAKAVVDLPAPFSGRVSKLYGQAGDIIKTGAALLEISNIDNPVTDNIKSSDSISGGVVGDLQSSGSIIEEAHSFSDGINASPAVRALARKLGVDLKQLNQTGHSITFADIKAARKQNTRRKIGPAARNLAAKLGVDLNLIQASGPKGFITLSDVEQANTTRTNEPVVHTNPIKSHPNIKAAPKVRATAQQLNIDLNQVQASGHVGNITLQDVLNHQPDPTRNKQAPIAALKLDGLNIDAQPIRGSRRAMFAGMSQARDRVMNTTIFDDAVITDWQEGQDISMRFVRAIIRACQAEPKLNAWLDEAEQSMIIHKDVNLGIAVDSENGLYVPVIKAADKKDPAAIRAELNAHRESIKARNIKPEQLQNCTITLSNFGMIAGKYATPIVSPPQVAIIGTGGFYEIPAFDKNSQIIKQRMVPLSLSFDHRAVTGGEAARFLSALISDLKEST